MPLGRHDHRRRATMLLATASLLLLVSAPGSAQSVGPDVVYLDCLEVTGFGKLGDIRAYALGSHTCNIGDADLVWGGVTPLLAMNAYRLHEGRLEQIGMSWVKNGTFASAGPGCGAPCNGNGGAVLGVGCRDIYDSNFNGLQGILGRRSDVNAFTGAYPGASGPDDTVIAKRLQISELDLVSPNALFFVEGVYVAPDDAEWGNALNNASYKRVTLQFNDFGLIPAGEMAVGRPAIYAWADHGLGAGIPDPSVRVDAVDVPNEGRFFVASKTIPLGGGQWRYEYAIFNLNSHRSAGSFVAPVPSRTLVWNIDFHDVDYHTGEIYDNNDWQAFVEPPGIRWSSPQTFAENENTNALRWGTMYNFSFSANSSPGEGVATLGLFRPGGPGSLTFSVPAPTGEVVNFIRGDGDGDGTFNGLLDALYLLRFQFQSGEAPPCSEAADADGDALFNGLLDGLFLLNHQFLVAPPPGDPYPGCGSDPDPASSLGCTPNGCP